MMSLVLWLKRAQERLQYSVCENVSKADCCCLATDIETGEEILIAS